MSLPTDSSSNTAKSRKSSLVDMPPPSTSTVPQTLLFAKEGDLDKVMSEAEAMSSEQEQTERSVPDAQNLADALGEAFEARGDDGRSKPKAGGENNSLEDSNTPIQNSVVFQRSTFPIPPSHDRSHILSQPSTPLQIESPAPELWGSAMPSTPKTGSIRSLRLSDADSQLGTEDCDDEDHGDDKRDSIESIEPELIMPSLSMPDRRPFTERGKNMGALRVCVAGRKSSGKSSLIRAIVQQCEDIVQVDPLTLRSITENTRRSAKGKDGNKATATGPRVLEILASTKAYPTWWTDMDESRVLRRRKSISETVLERNICFIDTIGQINEQRYSLVEYIEEAFWHINATEEHTDLERLNMVSGKGTNLVDVVLFIFSGLENLEGDLEQYSRLAEIANTIPLIGKSDLLTNDGIRVYKSSILRQTSSLRPFLFGKSVEEILKSTETQKDTSGEQENQAAPVETSEMLTVAEKKNEATDSSLVYPPFAVSSLTGSDTSEMDASLLMSSNYTPPLLPSELPSLVHHLFQPENISWLRHSTARKYLSWRDRQLSAAVTDLSSSADSAEMSPLRRARLLRLASEAEQRASVPGQMLIPRRSISAQNSSSLSGRSFTSRLSQNINLHPTVLDGIPRQDRARWLLERIHEEVMYGNIGVIDIEDGRHVTSRELSQLELNHSEKNNMQNLVHLSRRTGSSHISTSRKHSHRRIREHTELPAWARQQYHGKVMDPSDPLGLCNAWEGWGKAIMWGASGGIVVGVVWVVVVRGWAFGWKGVGWGLGE